MLAPTHRLPHGRLQRCTQPLRSRCWPAAGGRRQGWRGRRRGSACSWVGPRPRVERWRLCPALRERNKQDLQPKQANMQCAVQHVGAAMQLAGSVRRGRRSGGSPPCIYHGLDAGSKRVNQAADLRRGVGTQEGCSWTQARPCCHRAKGSSARHVPLVHLAEHARQQLLGAGKRRQQGLPSQLETAGRQMCLERRVAPANVPPPRHQQTQRGGCQVPPPL